MNFKFTCQHGITLVNVKDEWARESVGHYWWKLHEGKRCSGKYKLELVPGTYWRSLDEFFNQYQYSIYLDHWDPFDLDLLFASPENRWKAITLGSTVYLLETKPNWTTFRWGDAITAQYCEVTDFDQADVDGDVSAKMTVENNRYRDKVKIIIGYEKTKQFLKFWCPDCNGRDVDDLHQCNKNNIDSTGSVICRLCAEPSPWNQTNVGNNLYVCHGCRINLLPA